MIPMLFRNGSIFRMFRLTLGNQLRALTILTGTVDASNVTLAPGGKTYSRVFYITPTIPGKYFVLLNHNASLARLLRACLIVMTKE